MTLGRHQEYCESQKAVKDTKFVMQKFVLYKPAQMHLFPEFVTTLSLHHCSATKALKEFFEGLCKMFELVLLQANLNPESLAGKVLFFLTTIEVMFWYIIWGHESSNRNCTQTRHCISAHFRLEWRSRLR